MEHFFDGGRGGSDGDGQMGYRMLKGDGVGMERDGAVVIAAGSAIFEVTLNGAADISQLTTNLMVTTCMQVDVEEMIAAVGDRYLAVFEACQLGIGARRGEDIALVALLVLDKPIFKGTCRLRRGIFDHCPIVFLELSCAYLLHHTAQGLGSFGQQHHAGDRSVEAMDDTTVDLSGFMVALLDKLFHQIGQTGVASLVALGDLPRQLIDSQQMVVLVEYLIGNCHHLKLFPQ